VPFEVPTAKEFEYDFALAVRRRKFAAAVFKRWSRKPSLVPVRISHYWDDQRRHVLKMRPPFEAAEFRMTSDDDGTTYGFDTRVPDCVEEYSALWIWYDTMHRIEDAFDEYQTGKKSIAIEAIYTGPTATIPSGS
jgi:hypothetical protein